MSPRTSITPTIVEHLYREALALADDARAAFEFSGAQIPSGDAGSGDADTIRIALSCEALRTTTRMMHALAWLLNHRAFFSGELSEFQLRRHGRLPAAQPPSEQSQLALLDAATVVVVMRSSAFYARIARLDQAWRDQHRVPTQAIGRMQERLGAAFAANQG